MRKRVRAEPARQPVLDPSRDAPEPSEPLLSDASGRGLQPESTRPVQGSAMYPVAGHSYGQVAPGARRPVVHPASSFLIPVQRAPGDPSSDVDPELASRISAAAGGGTVLEAGARQRLEPHLGADLSNVRIHADSEADHLARSLDAAAFTTGRDIFFRDGGYAPATPEGLHLLAHEAAHTVQQAAVPDAGPAVADAVVVGAPDSALEREAGAAADGVSVAVPTMSPSPAVLASRLPAPASSAGGALVVQRAPPTATDKRLDTIERQQQILKKRQDAVEVDNKWRGEFMERIASYKQAILRITGGLDAAEKNFQAAQVAQAQIDQLKVQLVGGAGAFVFAAGFQWAAAQGLSRLGKSAREIEKIIEQWENPANSLVSSVVNVTAAVTAKQSAAEGQTPALGGGSIAYLTRNSEALEGHVQGFEKAFGARASKMRSASDEEWESFDLGKQELVYQQLFNAMKSSANGKEDLKEPAELAKTLERALWALWIRGQRQSELDAKQAALESGNPSDLDSSKAAPAYSVGSAIEDALNACGAAALAGVKLSGYFFLPNSPDDWKQKLLNWAQGFHESLSAAKGKGG